MKVAVPREKHSARLGQRASSHTVTSRSSRRRTRRGRAAGESGLPLRAHSGKRRLAVELTSSVYQGREGSLRAATDGARRRIHFAEARGGCGGCGAAPPLRFDDERLVLLFVAEFALDALGVRAG